MKKQFFSLLFLFYIQFSNAQLKWVKVDSLFSKLPASVHIYKTTDLLNGKPNIAYYVEADLKDKALDFIADTTYKRRLTPSQFYEKNDQPLLVVNCTFFSFATHQNLSVVIKDGKLTGYNIHTIAGRGRDTLTYRHPFGSALGISKKRKADVAWLYTDSSKVYPYAIQKPLSPIRDSQTTISSKNILTPLRGTPSPSFIKWEMQTAVGGGPVLLQDGEIAIANNEELKFAGRAIDDKHPRTAIGYTGNDKVIILVVQGRFPGTAEGATLTQEAQMLKEIGCKEALNLDGGGSSCMLVNGMETIKPSDKEGQRPVPAVFIVKTR